MKLENISITPHRGELTTEQRHPGSEHLGMLSIGQAFDLINGEDATIARAIQAVRLDICRAIELIAQRMRMGGRLIYVGAGTSGRLGVLDAAECPPTFLTNPDLVQGVIAGGADALIRSIEGAEDDSAEGAAEIERREVGASDVVFGITTGGTTPYVHGALHRAKERGAGVILLACVPQNQVPDDADVSIRVITGPEVLTGSTRMKAGTATKMVLNMISTITMVQLGKTYKNLMVDMNTQANAKLIDRGMRIIQRETGLSRDEAKTLLQQAKGRVKTAIVMNHQSVDLTTAESMLNHVDGHLDQLLP